MDPQIVFKNVIVAALFLGVVACAALVYSPGQSTTASQGGASGWNDGESDDD